MVCTKSGHVYEKRLIEKHIESTGREPITNDEISSEDIIPLKGM